MMRYTPPLFLGVKIKFFREECMFIKKVLAKYIIKADDKGTEEEEAPLPSNQETVRLEILLRQAARKAGAEAGDRLRGVFTPMDAGERRKRTMKDFNTFLQSPNIDVSPTQKGMFNQIKMRITPTLAKEFAKSFQQAYGYDEEYS
jgi:hypothetical protein